MRKYNITATATYSVYKREGSLLKRIMHFFFLGKRDCVVLFGQDTFCPYSDKDVAKLPKKEIANILKRRVREDLKRDDLTVKIYNIKQRAELVYIRGYTVI